MASPTAALLGALAAVSWFGAFVVLHVSILHARAVASHARVLLTVYAACGLGLVATLALVPLPGSPASRALAMVFGALTAGSLFVLYAPLYYVFSKSLSVQSMVALLEGGGALPRADLYRRFAGDGLLDDRLRTLVRSGYVTERAGVYRVTARGQRAVTPFRWLKAAWRLGPGG
jgi:hypothetical protein